MSHKTIVNGTSYEVKGGKCLVNGTSYDIKKGRTLIGGTGYDITFKPPMPVKGDLITMNLDGVYRLYRVLKVADTIAEVLTMWDLSTSQQFHKSINNYNGSYLDKYLNETWYGTLSSAAKAAIIAKNIDQYAYNFVDNSQIDTASSQADYSTKVLKAYVGNRYVYALDIEDLEMYFGGTGGSVSNKTPGTFSRTDLLQMFFNQTSTIKKYPWFRSAHISMSNAAWYVAGSHGYVGLNYVYGNFTVQGAFQIDLSKIGFTIN